MPIPVTITWADDCIRLIDQTKLPQSLEYIECRDVDTLWRAIKRLSVRGAPALGVAAGFGLWLGMKDFAGDDPQAFRRAFRKVKDYLATSRPTAVNLFHVLNDMEQVLNDQPNARVAQLKQSLRERAWKWYEDDRTTCRAIGKHGAGLIKSGMTVLTVCNAGALATVDYGTALAVFFTAHTAKKKFDVIACETRPLLQGARLTAWELVQAGIPATLICDNMAATLMKQGRIDAVITGADRIAANGDTANKIGTYMLAVLAKYHKIPFYVAAPVSTFDPATPNGGKIPIEERDPSEVKGFRGVRTAPDEVNVCNPAFDVTDHQLITAFITDRGLIYPPFFKKSFLDNMGAGIL